ENRRSGRASRKCLLAVRRWRERRNSPLFGDYAAAFRRKPDQPAFDLTKGISRLTVGLGMVDKAAAVLGSQPTADPSPGIAGRAGLSWVRPRMRLAPPAVFRPAVFRLTLDPARGSLAAQCKRGALSILVRSVEGIRTRIVSLSRDTCSTTSLPAGPLAHTRRQNEARLDTGSSRTARMRSPGRNPVLPAGPRSDSPATTIESSTSVA